MKNTTVILIFQVFLFVFCNYVNGQTKKIDSLKLLAKNELDDSIKSDLYIEISDEYWTDNPQKCMEYALKSLEIAKKINSHDLLLIAYRNMASASSFMGKMQEAAKYDRLSLTEAELTGNELKIIKCLVNYGDDLTGLSKFDSANIILDWGIRLATKINNEKQLAGLLLNKGNNLFNLSLFDSAEKTYQRGLIIAQKIEDSLRIVQYYNNYASVRLQRGIADSVVVEYMLKAIEINERKKDYENLGDCYVTLSSAYQLRKNHEKTISYLKKSYETFSIINNERKTATILANIADQYLQLGNMDSANKYAVMAIETGEKNNSIHGLASAYSIKGKILLETGNYENAISLLQKSYDEFLENKDHEGILLSGHYLGLALYKKGELSSAKKVLNNTLERSLTANNFLYIRNCSQLLADIYSKTGDYKNAVEYQNRFILANDTLNNVRNNKMLEDLATKYEISKKELLIEKQKESLARQKKERAYLLVGIVLLSGFLSTIGFLFFKTRKQKSAITRERNAVNNLTGILKHETARQFSSLSKSVSKILRVENPELQVSKALVEVETFQMLYTNLFLSSGLATISLKDAFERLFQYNCSEYAVSKTPEFIVTGKGNIIFKETDYLFHYINELIANSLLHAFKDTPKPKITINVTCTDNTFEILYEDNGCGLPSEKEQLIPGKGLYYINVYAKQNLRGILETDFINGSKFKLTFSPANGK